MAQTLETIRRGIRDAIVSIAIGSGDIIEIEVRREKMLEAAAYLRDNPELRFDFLSCVSGVDMLDRLQAVYHVHSLPNHLSLRLKATVDLTNPVVDSLVPVWPGANWHEREAYDLLGITFAGHPDPRRMLLEEDFEGHPLRKSYLPPKGRLG